MDEAERFDRLALLHAGRARALDTPVALREAFDGEVLEARIERPREARALVESLDPPGLVRRAAVFGNHLHVTVGDAAAARGPIERALSEAGLAFSELEQIAPSLEDVFIEQIAAAEEER
jgi:ABC-2 type transport system ATP-binding protein